MLTNPSLKIRLLKRNRLFFSNGICHLPTKGTRLWHSSVSPLTIKDTLPSELSYRTQVFSQSNPTLSDCESSLTQQLVTEEALGNKPHVTNNKMKETPRSVWKVPQNKMLI